MNDIPVLIAGGGPVGLSLACDLRWRGINAMLVEANESTTIYPKMDVTNSRTMEHYRRIGLSQKIRDNAVPEHHSMACRWTTDLAGWQLGVKNNGSAQAQKEKIRSLNDGRQPAEPHLRMPQYDLEPLLMSEVDSPDSGIEVRSGWKLLSFEQDKSGVTSVIRNVKSGAEETVRSQYLIGADGGNSVVRKGLGITYEGLPKCVRIYMLHFLTDEYEKVQPFGQSWHIHMMNTNSTLISQDDKRSFTTHTVIDPDLDVSKIDPYEWLASVLGIEIDCEIKIAEQWSAHWLVAKQYGEGRVWLAGDSSHQYLPTGGYGMNTGVADAMDVSWKISAMLEGWGGKNLLDSITNERRAAGLHSRRGSFAQATDRINMHITLAPEINDVGDIGDTARSSAKESIELMRADERGNLGVALGYSYADSPIVHFEAEAPPELSVWDYRPTTYPGFRAPHVFLECGSSIFDKFGNGFTLINFGNHDCSIIQEAAVSRGVPLHILNIEDRNARKVYEKDILLIRPDQHVAWRSDFAPFVKQEAERIIDVARGE